MERRNTADNIATLEILPQEKKHDWKDWAIAVGFVLSVLGIGNWLLDRVITPAAKAEYVSQIEYKAQCVKSDADRRQLSDRVIRLEASYETINKALDKIDKKLDRIRTR